MQLPFLQRVAPHARIVPLLMGWQTATTANTLGEALSAVIAGRRAVLDREHGPLALSRRPTAARLDATVVDHVRAVRRRRAAGRPGPQPAPRCGGGPTVAVMRAAQRLGARDAVILNYADSGDVSGDKSSVVGYLAAVLGTR